MNRHIIKRNVESDSPIVWCGRSIPANSDAVTLNQAALCSSIKVCKNCTKAAINALKPYGSFELDVDYPDELRSLADIKRIAGLEKERAVRDLEQQAKGLEDYVSKTMDNSYILHLDPEDIHHCILINLNATALSLLERAKALKEQE